MPHRILIVDDHYEMRRSLKTVLEAHPDWQVCGEANDGLEAVQQAAELRPDLIIMDFWMPGMDGIKATQKILLYSPHIPVLLYTNHMSPQLSSLAASNGVRVVVSKSDPVDQLLEAVEALLIDRRAPAREAVTAAKA